ncbi:MAG: monovalent cation/H+ antiporter complex subunit F [Candidatus Krumholzibacteria bacterium]|jgi:multicomponent Na+:H+ antiporter subunit F|nr:monovalent cation/H+ antiporter complex subunit F [Candidatus Krumholzibacteria bacterium]
MPAFLTTLLAGVVLAMGLASLRLLRGPTLADRVLALDVLVIAAVGGVALLAWQTGRAVFLDVAVAVAMVTFISAVALAWYLEQRGEP